jgi:hypothetical protein
MTPTHVKSTFRKNSNTEEKITTGFLGTVPYMIVRRTEYGAPDVHGGRHYTVKHFVHTKNEIEQWVPLSDLRGREVLVSFGIVQGD